MGKSLDDAAIRQGETTLRRLGAELGKLFTAAVVRVDYPEVSLESYAGTVSRNNLRPIKVDTRFDLASITKIFTMSAVLRLVDRGEMELDAPLGKYLPNFGLSGGRDQVTIRRVLAHTGGLPTSIQDIATAGDTGQERWETFRRSPNDSIAKTNVNNVGRYVYSDLGFILLGNAIEKVTRTDLKEAMGSLVIAPLGLTNTSWGGYGPTPETNHWYNRGIVNDRKTGYLWRVSGCAGLFSSAADLSRLTRTFIPGDNSFLSQSLKQESIREQISAPSGVRRGLGWELRSTIAGEPEQVLDQSAFGHTGSTGTWVFNDPSRGMTVTILTNSLLLGQASWKVGGPLLQFYHDIAELAVKTIDGASAHQIE